MTGLEATGLPLLPFLPEISARLAEAGSLVLVAEPGAGKTSLVPLYLAGGPAAGGRILLVEPRRVAAVAAATRLAELAGEPPGRRFGYRVRGDTRSSPSALVEAVTEGVLLRMLQDDPSLPGVGLLILDEFHERSLGGDLCLALALEARALAPGLRILVMSATLDPGPVAALLGAPVIAAPGRAWPVETRHAPLAGGPGFEEGMAGLALGLLDGAAGDLLVFLPGAGEIERTARSLRARGAPAEILALHGSLPLEEQRRVLLPPAGAGRRIILATSLAETSLTVPRVSMVLDSGLARLSRFEPRSGMNRLVTERETADRAEQRRGRAGRLGPGLCLRAWAASEILPARAEPEILRAELSQAVLEAAVWGARSPGDLPWLTPPPSSAWATARELLRELGILDAEGRPTDLGRRAASLGTEPRLAVLVLRGAEAGAAGEACALAALLSEDLRGASRQGEGARGDLGGSLERLEGGDPALDRVRREAARLRAAIGGNQPRGDSARRAGQGPSLGALLAAGFPDRIARRQAEPEARRGELESPFRLPGGRELKVTGALARCRWLVAADASAGAAGEPAGRLFWGAELTEAEALEALSPLIEESELLEWNGAGYRAKRSRRAGSILLSETALGALPRETVAAALCRRIAVEGIGGLREDPGFAALLERARWYLGAGDRARSLEWPDLSDEVLAAQAGDWLGPFVEASPSAVLPRGTVLKAFEALLGAGRLRELEREAPSRLQLPSGAIRPISYSTGPVPVLEARVQEFFGLDVHPRAAGCPLVLRLLDPGGKPLQVTRDLPGFWRSSWFEARKALRGRYPKHDWPEDPASATPSRSGVKGRR